MRIPFFTIRLPLLAAALVAIAAFQLAPVPARAQNPELDALLKKGVEFPSGQMRRLRPPTLKDGMTGDEQLKAIEAVLAMRPARVPTYKQFAAKQGPSVLLIDRDPQYDSGQPGHSINLWFAVRGQLATVANPQFLKSQFKPDKQGRIDTLKPADLQQRQLTPRKTPNSEEWFVHGIFTLLQTQVLVQVQGTVDAVETKSSESATLACMIDRRFDGDANYPNDWRPVVNGVVQNRPTLYYSCGGYARITKLAKPAGMMLFEYHLIYDEPYGWFNGKDILREKLPAMSEQDVQSFRIKVHSAELE